MNNTDPLSFGGGQSNPLEASSPLGTPVNQGPLITSPSGNLSPSGSDPNQLQTLRSDLGSLPVDPRQAAEGTAPASAIAPTALAVNPVGVATENSLISYPQVTSTSSPAPDSLTGTAVGDLSVGDRSAVTNLTRLNPVLANLPSIPGDVFIVPGAPTESVLIRFAWTFREASYNNEIGVFGVDAQGRVNGIAPGAAEYAQAALSSPTRQVVFASGQNAGNWQELRFQGGDRLAFYLIQNSTTERWLQKNPQNTLGKRPLAFFAIDGVNPDGFDHVQAQQMGNGTWQLKWEDLTGGGDRDFDDVVMLLGDPGVLTPGKTGQTVPSRFEWLFREASYNNEMGAFWVDNADGRIGNLLPGDPGYAAAALAADRRQVIFGSAQTAGAVTTLDLPAEKFLGWYLIQNASTEQFLQQNPTNQIGSGPLAFFSFAPANPDGLNHVNATGANEFAWEDLTGGGDLDYNDLIFRYAFGDPTGNPTDPPPLVRPRLAINDVRVQEGDEGSGAATLTVSLSAASSLPITLDFATQADSATANEDFQTVRGSLRFEPGEVAKSLLIPLLWDRQPELDEQFRVNLSNATNAEIEDGTGIVTIVDNDPKDVPRPQVTVNDARILEADSGTTNLVFTVSLSATPTLPVSVDYTTVDGSARQPADYTPVRGTLTFHPGDNRSQTIAVPIVGDSLPEPEETFTLQLSNPVNAVLADAQGLATIADNDAPPQVTINDARVVEGNSGTTDLVFTVSLSAASQLPIAMDYTTVAGSALSGQDYTPIGGTLTFNPGDPLTRTLAIPVVGDQLPEADETFTLQLSNPVNAVLADAQGLATIQNDDPLLPNDIWLREGSNFQVTHEMNLVVPPTSTVLSITFADLTFDTTNPNFINDAFEAALVDANGNSLVHTIGNGQTAFFNLTEGLPAKLASGVTLTDRTLQVNLTGIAPNTPAKLILRLVNDDGDTTTAVRITQIGLLPGDGTVPSGSLNRSQITAPLDRSIDFTHLADVSASLQAEYGQTSWNQATTVLSTDLALRNLGTYGVNGPLLVAVKNLSDPTVQVIGADGVTPEGLPYYDFSAGVDRGLDPTEVTDSRTLTFQNPTGGQFTYDLVILADLNARPLITSSPDLEVLGGQTYTYRVKASDPDGDALRYGLGVAPTGMQIDANSGVITWDTRLTDIANHAITVRVSDGRGGTTEQIYTLAVIAAPPNRPPNFTSLPGVDAQINQPYRYDAEAVDPDQDPLRYRLLVGPEGMRVDPLTGLVQWTPPPVLALGDTVVGQISLPGDRATFTLSGVTGQRLYLDQLQEFTGQQIRVYNPSGNLIDQGNGLFTLTETGNYRVVVDGSGDRTGRYGFSLIDPALLPETPLDTVISGQLSPGSEDDLFRFQGLAGQKLFFDQLSNQGNLDWVLLDASNRIIAQTPSMNDMEVDLTHDGEYLLVLRGREEFTTRINYSFSILTPEVVTQPLSLNRVIAGTIGEKREQDRYTFTGKAGQQLFYDALGGDPLVISLSDPTGRVIYSTDSRNDWGPDNGLTLSMDGLYRFTVNGDRENTGNYRFRLLDRSVAPMATLDTDIAGTLDDPLGSTAYRFTVPDKQYLYVDGLAGDGVWSIYGPDGRSIRTAGLRDDQEFELNAGEYLLVMQGNGSSLNYNVRLVTPELTTTAMQLGQIISGSIGEKGEQNSYTFTGKAGQQLFYDALGGDGFGVSFYDPTGKVIYSGTQWWGISIDSRSDRGPDSGLTLSMDGIYRLTVDGFREGTGNYRFRLLDRAVAPMVALDTDIVGTLDNPLGSTAYRFTVPDKQYLYVDGLEGDGAWIIYGPDGRFISAARLSDDQEFELNAGEYLLVMQGDGSSPNYKVRLVTPELTTIAMQLGQIISGSIGEKGEQDRYTFTGKAGQQLFYDALGGDGFGISLYDPTGKAIYGADSRNDRGTEAGLTLSMDGTYRLTMDGAGANTGNYSFRLLDRSVAPVVALDTDIVGTLGNPLGSTLYRFNLPEHRTVAVDGIEGEGNWILYGPDGRLIGFAGLASDAEIQLYPGEYLLAIQGNGSSPNYKLQIKDLSPFTPPTFNDAVLTFGNTINGTISQPGERTGYSFTGKAGQKLFYDALGGDLFGISLYDPTGNVIYETKSWGIAADSRNDRGPDNGLTLSMDGTYRLTVDGFRAGIGNYRFRLLDGSTAPVVALDTDIVGNLDDPLGSAAYRFTVLDKQYLYVDTLEGDGAWIIYGPDGRYINSARLNDDREFELNAGEYLLVMQGYGSSLNYKVRLITPELTTTAMQLGQIMSGSISEKGERDSYTFTGKAGQQLFYDALGGDPMVIYLYDPTGRGSGIPDSRDDRGPDNNGLTLSMDGTYRLTVDGAGENTGNYRFRLLDRSVAPMVALDTDIVGALDDPLGSTAYRFTVPDKQYLYVDGLSGEGVWSIYGPDGRYISSARLNDDREFELNAGEYLLVMQGYGSSLDYKVRLVTPELTTTAMQLGQIISGSIGEKGEQNSYTFTGKAGQQLFYDALGGDGFGVSFYDPTGKVIYSGTQWWGISIDSRSDRGPDNGLTLSMDGIYRLTVDGFREGTGNYRFRLLDGSMAPRVALDTDIAGTLDDPLGSTAYRFTVPDKQYLYVDGLEGDGAWIIYGPDGRYINSARLNSDQEFELNAGEYLLVMQGYGSSPDYKVRLVTPELTTTAMQLGQIISGSISEKGEQDSYTFTGKAGQQLFYDALGGDGFGVSFYDPTGKVMGPSWREYTTDSRSDRGPDMGLTLSMDGTYRLTVDGAGEGTGNYRFRLLDRSVAPMVALDTDIAGTLDNPLGSTAYRFTVPEKQYLYVDSLEGDGGWLIYGADGRLINTAQLNEDREFELNAGEYLLVMQGYGSNPNYNVRLITPELTTTSMQLGQIISGSIGEKGEQDTYTFTGTVGQRFFLDAIAGDGGLRAKLYGPGNNNTPISDRDITSDWSPLTLTTQGTYRLVIDGADFATGAYRFSLNDLGQSPLLTIGTSMTGSLEPGNSVDLYRFNGTQGTTLRFDLAAAQWSGANWVLYDPGNQVIAAPPGGDPDFQVVLPSTGAYILAIQGSNDAPVNYAFQVTDTTVAPVPNQGLNTLYSGTFTGGVINHVISATAGTQVYFDGQTTSGADVRVRLLNPDGSPVFSDQDTRFDRAPVTLAQTGNYTLQVFGGAGDYALKLLELPRSLRGPGVNYLELGGVVSGTLAGAESKVYTFEGLTGLPFYFNGMEGGGIAATLYAPNGAIVFNSGLIQDNFGPLSLTQDGRYQLVLANQGTAPQPYRFQPLEFLTGPEIALNLPVSGTLRSGQESQFYKLKGEAGQTLFFDTQQGSNRNRWLLYGPGNTFLGGTILGEDFAVNLTATGEYILLIEGGGDSTPVNYQFRVLAYDPPVADIMTPGTGESVGVDGTLAVEFAVKLQVTDGQGGQDLQDYTIRVGPDPTNGNPTIVSTPSSRFALDTGVYQYSVKALDPDRDAPRYRLLEGPLGALIDSDSGELFWVPEPTVVAGSQVTFAVQVTDGRGGFETQRFSVDIFNHLGTIQGAVFDDLNRNGVMDTQLLKGDNPSLVLALDVSGSTMAPFRGNRAYPEIKTVLDAEVAAALALIDALIAQGLGNTAQIGLIPHRDLAVLQDMDLVTPGLQSSTTPLADRDNNGIADIREILASYRPFGGNNFTHTLDAIRQLVQALPGNPNVIFMSDGYDNSFERDPAAGLRVLDELKASGINFNAFAIGEASTLVTLQQLDSDAERLVDIVKLVSVFSGFDPRYAIEPLKDNVTVYLDLNNNGTLDGAEPSQLTQPSARREDSVYPFSFDNLLPGTYTLRQVVPTGYRQTAPVADPLIDRVTVAGETFSHLFGLHQVTAQATNSNPVFSTTIAPTTLGNGQSFRYQAQAIDPDADPITYDLILNPAGMVVDPDTGMVTWVPTAEQVERYYTDLRETQARLAARGQGDTAPQVVELNVLLRVRDPRGGQALQTIALTLLSPNAAPTFTSNPTQIVAPQIGKPFRYQATAIDADGDPITYALGPNSPLGVTLDPATGLLSWTPTPAQLGQQEIILQVRDSKGGTATQTLTPTVILAQPNTTPQITSRPRLETRVETPYLYQLAVTDPDGDPLSFSLSDAPTGLSLSQGGLLSWRPDVAQIGDHQVSITVTDGQGGSDRQTYTLSVRHQAANYAPEITSQPPELTNLERGYQYRATAIDPDGDVLFWNLTQAPAGVVIDAQTGVVSWQPAPNQVGDHTLTLEVADLLGATTSQTFTLQVRGLNTPPQITSTPLTQIGLNQPYRYNLTAIDPEGDPLRFSLGTHPEGMTIDAATGLVLWTPQAAQVGNHTIELLAQDAQGGSGRQTYTLVVSREAVNQAPTITSTPGFWADVVGGYRYQLAATDPNGDRLTYSLITGPSGVTVDPASGLLQWQPTAAQVGEHSITVAASDPSGLGASQRYTLTVTPTNPAPVIRSNPLLTAIPEVPYHYDVWAADPTGEPMRFALTQAPEGMTIDAAGRISWLPGAGAVGTYPVAVTVADSRGAQVVQSFNLAVVPDTQKPLVNLKLNNPSLKVGDTATLVVTAADNVGVEGLTLTIDGTPVAVDASGRAIVPITRSGNFNAIATAVDAAGNVGSTTVQFAAIDPRDNTAPFVDFTSLTGGEVMRTFTDILGTVTDDNLLFYTLSVAPVAGGSFTEIARGTNVVTNGVLGKFDPSGLLNDSYILRLAATDANGKTSTVETEVNVTGELKLGNFQLSFNDLSIPVAGLPIQVTRTYDTFNAGTTDDFGYGWRLEFRDTDLRTSLGRDPELEDLGVSSKGFKDGTRVYITLPGGKREGFTFKPKQLPINRYLPPEFNTNPLYQAAFEADAGSTSTLTVRNATLMRSETGEFVSPNGGRYNPANAGYGFGGYYELTTKEGIVYRIDGMTGDLDTVTDRNGNILTFTDSSITSSTGQTVTFERDAQNRITAVVDPLGQKVTYQYDALGDLVSVTDRQGNTTQFDYNDTRVHYLDKVIDPLGQVGVRSDYDAQGRLIKLVDAAGKPVELIHDPANSIERVKDQLGNVTTYEYDSRGNVVREVNALGGITRRTYDADNNTLSETDPLGHTTSYTYDDQGNQLTMTDPLGRVTRSTYDTFGNVLTTTDPSGQTTTNLYDRRGNLLAISGQANGTMNLAYDGAGNLTQLSDGAGTTTFEYDRQGNVVREVNALGQVKTYTYDGNGNQLTQTQTLTTATGVRTLVTQTEYDAQGRVIKVIDPEGGVTRTVYNKAGQRVESIDALNRVTKFVYDDRGQLTETIYPDSTPATDVDNPRTRTEYDAAGRTIASVDELGRRTVTEYDALGRQVAVIYPDETPNNASDNPRTRTEYDAAGRVTFQVDARGNRTESVYNAAGQVVETILPDDTPLDRTDNPRFKTTYDAAGRQIAQTDALGQITTFLYDDLGRPIGQAFRDGTRSTTQYDAAGRVTARIDQAGRRTAYEYDALGRLKAVVDALGQRTAYDYNELGNLTVQTDANRHATRYDYDGLGRRIATELPEGQRSTSTYDAAGLLLSMTDFNGQTTAYRYDERDRLVLKDLPGAEADIAYTYTLTGQLNTVADGRGITTYSYDAQERLRQRTDPDGRSIAYTYDAAGNRTSVIIPSGNTIYTYDAQSRLKTVIDPENGRTNYFYDLNGRLVRTELPNGTTETREYDGLNRLTFLENRGPGGVINSFRYTLDATGNRTAVVEHDGRRVEYSYDVLYRLTAERIFDPGATAPTRVMEYAYDAVGNRLSRSDTGEGTTLYLYDKNDQLKTTTTTNGVVTSYIYDNNGNTIGKATNDNSVSYNWDSQNRLVSADTNGDGVIDVINQYNANGIRVVQFVNGAETRFLIDEVQRYAQVVEEYTPGGIIKVSYVYGNDLISQNREGDRSFYHVDGLGSTRSLTDQVGLVTDRYIYDAFGQVLTQIGNTESSYLFAGEQRDTNLGLDYLRARYLDAVTGRFISRDSFEGFAKKPITLHKYLYANDNPIYFIDPSGLFGISTIIEQLNTLSIRTYLAGQNLGYTLSATVAGAGAAALRIAQVGFERFNQILVNAYIRSSDAFYRFSSGQGWEVKDATTGGWRIRAFQVGPIGDSGKATYRILNIKEIIRIEAHPIGKAGYRSWTYYPHFHPGESGKIEVFGKSFYHNAILEPILLSAGLLLGAYLLTSDKDDDESSSSSGNGGQ